MSIILEIYISLEAKVMCLILMFCATLPLMQDETIPEAMDEAVDGLSQDDAALHA